jgi:hypothetical protein
VETLYTDELGRTICDMIADGASMRSIGEMPGMPSRRTMRLWLETRPAFKQRYDIARHEWIHAIEEELCTLADSAQTIAETSANPAAAINGLRATINTKQWLLSKLAPSVYGDRIAQEITGKDGAALMPQPAPDIPRLAMMLRAVIEAGQPPRTIDQIAPPSPALPKPDPESEERRLAAARTGAPLRSSLGTADEPLPEFKPSPAPSRRPPAEDLIDIRDARDARRIFERIAPFTRQFP